MLPLPLSDLVLEWYDLDRGVAQLSQVLSFLAEVIVTLVSKVLLLADVINCRSAIPSSLLDTLCHGLVLSIYHLFEEIQSAVATCPNRGLSQPAELEIYHFVSYLLHGRERSSRKRGRRVLEREVDF